jgi:hypothetical protein
MKIRTQIIIVALLRIILNTMHRMVYPFLAIFARGLGVDVTAISFALAGRNLAGILGPVFAPVADLRAIVVFRGTDPSHPEQVTVRSDGTGLFR